MTAVDSLAARIGERLAAAGRGLATAESCTGGLIASTITDVPGASAYFLGGVVAYSNPAKVFHLGVDERTLATEGAVSEAVARQMAEGAQRSFGADYGLAVTGIAGPSGGSPEKPVGLVFIALAGAGTTRVERHRFAGTRAEIKRDTMERALTMLSEELS